jgi:hypothetical protein
MNLVAVSCPERPSLPAARGPLSSWVIRMLRGGRAPSYVPEPEGGTEAGIDEDVQLSLYVCYELHYRGFASVDDGWEWNPQIVAFRTALERYFVDDLPIVAAPAFSFELPRAAVSDHLWALANDGGGPSLSSHMLECGTLRELREFAVHRSAYQLKEADPHTWALPRLTGVAKANMATIQYDEYGSGAAPGAHSTRFATTMRELDLDDRYGAYLDVIPAVTLATVNLMSMFGLHRRWRGALVGHLALFEMTSVAPMQRYSDALRRLGLSENARSFYDVHVVADTTHQHLGAAMADGLATAEPELAPSIVWGAECLTVLERRFAEHVLGSWRDGRSSLLDVCH